VLELWRAAQTADPTCVDVSGGSLLVASLADIIRSKRAARRPRDLAVLEILERTREEAAKPPREARRRRARE